MVMEIENWTTKTRDMVDSAEADRVLVKIKVRLGLQVFTSQTAQPPTRELVSV
jgi:hypothetical protein